MRRSDSVLGASGRPDSLSPALRALLVSLSAACGVHADEVSFTGEIAPLLGKFCLDCHGPEKAKADLSFEPFMTPRYAEEGSVTRDRKDWERVLKMLEAGEMPPAKRPQPSAEERAKTVRWIRTELERLDCTGAVDPGHVTLRRLNRSEYNNTIRDLTGVDFHPADGFPADEVGYGFDNIGDVLSLHPLLFEKYLEAAEEIVAKTIEAERRRVFGVRIEAEKAEVDAAAVPVEVWALSLQKEGEVFAQVDFPRDGEYLLRARAYGEQAGPEPARMALRIDGRDVKTSPVEAVETAPKVYETRTRIAAGKRRFSIAYLNNYVDTTNPDPALRGDRNLVIDWFEAEELPSGGAPAATAVFTRRPLDDTDREACAREILARFAGRAFRRPPRSDEIERLAGIVREEQNRGEGFEGAVGVALQAVLISPNFLFRVEEAGAGELAGKGSRLLSDHALASRLSYFLWSSMPDDELLRLAGEGRLRSPEVLEAQVARMIDDPRSREFVENFASQWLQTRFLDAVSPDPKLFPTFNEKLRQAMKTETLLFFEAILRENRSLLDFIDADFTFVNELLARHYGIEGVTGEEFRRVPLGGTPRGGILTQASILTFTSNPTRTSPVKRGKWILEQILGTPPPLPPPNVPELNEAPEAILSGSLRERLERHRADPNCATCHSKMDPLGFAFENFDAVGAWRDFDGKFLIDPSGSLPDEGGRKGASFEGADGLRAVLKTRKEAFARALSEKMLTYALGRGLEYYDRCAVDRILEELGRDGYRMRTVVLAVAKSHPFRNERAAVARGF